MQRDLSLRKRSLQAAEVTSRIVNKLSLLCSRAAGLRRQKTCSFVHCPLTERDSKPLHIVSAMVWSALLAS